MEWNNKQVDITDHYCLVEIKHSGQRRFISLCFGVLSFLSPAENGNQHDAIKGPSPVFVYTPIIEKLITERQNLMREILCASLMFCCFFIFSPIFLPCILFFCFFSFLQFFPFSIFFSFFFFFFFVAHHRKTSSYSRDLNGTETKKEYTRAIRNVFKMDCL